MARPVAMVSMPRSRSRILKSTLGILLRGHHMFNRSIEHRSAPSSARSSSRESASLPIPCSAMRSTFATPYASPMTDCRKGASMAASRQERRRPSSPPRRAVGRATSIEVARTEIRGVGTASPSLHRGGNPVSPRYQKGNRRRHQRWVIGTKALYCAQAQIAFAVVCLRPDPMFSTKTSQPWSSSLPLPSLGAE